jgi:hypothetical protein
VSDSFEIQRVQLTGQNIFVKRSVNHWQVNELMSHQAIRGQTSISRVQSDSNGQLVNGMEEIPLIDGHGASKEPFVPLY